VSNVSALAIGQDDTSWQAEFCTDMMGTVRAVNATMPFLEKSKAAAIVVIASVSSREVDFAAGPYGLLKAALIHYAKGLPYQLAAKNIRVTALSPGNTYFPAGVWEKIEHGNTQSDGTHGQARGDGAGRGIFGHPGGKFHYRYEFVVDGALTRGVQF
jgi:3-oxoacyl-[acyl-carrier protein] reductase